MFYYDKVIIVFSLYTADTAYQHSSTNLYKNNSIFCDMTPYKVKK
jgi:hypothetical protein